MNPYMTVAKIRKVHNYLNNYAYNAFDKLEPSMRIDINNILDNLKDLANEIEKSADDKFNEEDFKL